MSKVSIGIIFLGAAIFTVIELIALTQWFSGSTPAIHFSTYGKVVLYLLIYLEHIVSVIIGVSLGKDGKLLSALRNDG